MPWEIMAFLTVPVWLLVLMPAHCKAWIVSAVFMPAFSQFLVIILTMVLGEAGLELATAAALTVNASLASSTVRKGGGCAVMAWLAETSLACKEQMLVSKFCLI